MENKILKQKFLDFLKKEGIAFISGSYARMTINIIKIPFNDKFDYLFRQESFVTITCREYIQIGF